MGSIRGILRVCSSLQGSKIPHVQDLVFDYVDDCLEMLDEDMRNLNSMIGGKHEQGTDPGSKRSPD
jgi:hypothetical protein